MTSPPLRQAVAEEVGGAHVVPTDVTDAEACAALAAKAVAHHGRLDIAVGRRAIQTPLRMFHQWFST